MSDAADPAHEANEKYLTALLDACDGLQNAMDVTSDEAVRTELHVMFEQLHALMDAVPGFADDR
jgi:hypothetical protein